MQAGGRFDGMPVARARDGRCTGCAS